jgi:hypothetical protein
MPVLQPREAKLITTRREGGKGDWAEQEPAARMSKSEGRTAEGPPTRRERKQGTARPLGMMAAPQHACRRLAMQPTAVVAEVGARLRVSLPSRKRVRASKCLFNNVEDFQHGFLKHENKHSTDIVAAKRGRFLERYLRKA